MWKISQRKDEENHKAHEERYEIKSSYSVRRSNEGRLTAIAKIQGWAVTVELKTVIYPQRSCVDVSPELTQKA
jgi:hypothetical protein